MNHHSSIIGIDGGGTKTHSILATLDGEFLASYTEGASNPHVVGFEASARVIAASIEKCLAHLHESASPNLKIVAGIAGIGRPADQETLRSALVRINTAYESIVLTTDVRIALEGALPWRSGIVLIAGTGSIAYYRDNKGGLIRSGGWGRILGDEGSGFTIAREGLRAVLLQHDGRGTETALTPLALRHYAIPSVDQLITEVYKKGTEISSFAPLVVDAAANGDDIAIRIIDEESKKLVSLVKPLIDRSISEGKLQLAMIGGLLEHKTAYSVKVRTLLKESYPNVYVQRPKFSPVVGALILALNEFK